jgi:hypothetical protein
MCTCMCECKTSCLNVYKDESGPTDFTLFQSFFAHVLLCMESYHVRTHVAHCRCIRHLAHALLVDEL